MLEILEINYMVDYI